eukprot:jgi/Mesvir1/23832/Mv10637-RA.1
MVDSDVSPGGAPLAAAVAPNPQILALRAQLAALEAAEAAKAVTEADSDDVENVPPPPPVKKAGKASAPPPALSLAAAPATTAAAVTLLHAAAPAATAPASAVAFFPTARMNARPPVSLASKKAGDQHIKGKSIKKQAPARRPPSVDHGLMAHVGRVFPGATVKACPTSFLDEVKVDTISLIMQKHHYNGRGAGELGEFV